MKRWLRREYVFWRESGLLVFAIVVLGSILLVLLIDWCFRAVLRLMWSY